MLLNPRHIERITQCSNTNDELVIRQLIHEVLFECALTLDHATLRVNVNGVRLMEMVRLTEAHVSHGLDDRSAIAAMVKGKIYTVHHG